MSICAVAPPAVLPFTTALTLAAALASSGVPGALCPPSGSGALRLPRPRADYSRLPLSFAPDPGADGTFLSHGTGYSLRIERTQAVLTLQPPKTSERRRPALAPPVPPVRLRMEVIGGSTHMKAEGAAELPGKVNYFFGKDPAKWRQGLSTYARVRCPEVYPGIDLVYYGKGQELEYDFVVAPGADPSHVRLRFHGADEIKLAENGDLILGTAAGEVRQKRPVVYQDTPGGRKRIPGEYALCSSTRARRSAPATVGFRLGEYDRSRPLTIDPVLMYSGYVGGHDTELPGGMAVGPDGSVHLAGTKISASAEVYNVFVTRLSPAGDAVVYTSYFWGGFDAAAGDIAVDAAGNAWVTGATSFSGFPVVNPIQPNIRGSRDAILMKLDPAGTLLYSTFLGGSASDTGLAVTTDAEGAAYLAGSTESDDFPTASALQPARRGGSDAFIAKVSSDGQTLALSTFFGGSDHDSASGLALDSARGVVLAGNTRSPDLPVRNAVQPTYGGGPIGSTDALGDAFVARLDLEAGAVTYSTYLGGRQREGAGGAGCLAVDARGSAYVTGWTESPDFPTRQPLQRRLRGSQDAFVAKLSPEGHQLVYSTFLGGARTSRHGTDSDAGAALVVDAIGSAYVTGSTGAKDFPLVRPLQRRPGVRENSAAFISQLHPAGIRLLFSSYFGGGRFGQGSLMYNPGGGTEGTAIALDAAGHLYVSGYTAANDTPVATAPQQSGARGGTPGNLPLQRPGGQGDTFVARISFDATAESGRLVLSHRRLHFARARKGETRRRTLRLWNRGRTSLRGHVGHIQPDPRNGSDEFSSISGTGSFVLAPGECRKVVVQLTGSDSPAAYLGYLAITTSDPENAVVYVKLTAPASERWRHRSR